MPQADIEINGTAASDEDLPIGTLVQLSNDDIGDETTYLWEIVSQPAGAVDALSSTVIENPTITPNKEGSYLFQLTVDATLATEAVDRKLFRIRSLKTFAGFLAAEEDTEADSDEGWKTRQNANLRTYDNNIFNGTIVAGVATAALALGEVVRITSVETIKSGLPGEERLPGIETAPATNADVLDTTLGIFIGQPDGTTSAVATDLVLIQVLGYLDQQQVGAPAVGDPVFVDDAAAIALAVGTNTRQIGHVIETGGGFYRAFIDGTLP